MSNVSGLAAAVRGSTESDTFDLAGQNVKTITTNISAAFQDPLAVSEMIRITFVTGAGKLGRQKYDADAAKAVTSALREMGFEEDRGASCVKECAGSFKLQHDTGKNLKTVVVFPRISEANGDNDEDGGGDNAASSSNSATFFPKGSPKEMITMSSKSVFESMVKSRCPSWSQKKGCVAAISDIKNQLSGLEQKLFNGTPLTYPEQIFFDSVSSSDLDEKQNYVKDLMHQQVDNGLITIREKTQLLSQVKERLETIQAELNEASREKKAKKVEKLNIVKGKAEARKEKLTNIAPRPPHRLRHEAEIFKLRGELQPLLDLEDDTKGRLLSVKETQSLARKEDVLEEIVQLEEKSRGWFEDDEGFALRLEACKASWAAQSKQKKKTKKKAPPTSSSGWKATTSKPVAWGKPKPKHVAKVKTAGGGGGVFAAMMMDSDSE